MLVLWTPNLAWAAFKIGNKKKEVTGNLFIG